MTDLSGHGISLALPPAWEGRMGLRRPAATSALQPALTGRPAPGETFYPVTHLANFALPADRGDFGSGAVDVMGAVNCLVVLIEFGPESAHTPLFASTGIPQPQAAQFDPNTLQRRISGQVGYQRFFTRAGRPFCLYVVLGGTRYAGPLTATVREVLAGARIEPR